MSGSDSEVDVANPGEGQDSDETQCRHCYQKFGENDKDWLLSIIGEG